jgi:hypothetical protein
MTVEVGEKEHDVAADTFYFDVPRNTVLAALIDSVVAVDADAESNFLGTVTLAWTSVVLV